MYGATETAAGTRSTRAPWASAISADLSVDESTMTTSPSTPAPGQALVTPVDELADRDLFVETGHHDREKIRDGGQNRDRGVLGVQLDAHGVCPDPSLVNGRVVPRSGRPFRLEVLVGRPWQRRRSYRPPALTRCLERAAATGSWSRRPAGKSGDSAYRLYLRSVDCLNIVNMVVCARWVLVLAALASTVSCSSASKPAAHSPTTGRTATTAAPGTTTPAAPRIAVALPAIAQIPVARPGTRSSSGGAAAPVSSGSGRAARE